MPASAHLWQILLVGKHQQYRIAQLVFIQHALQLLARFSDTVSVVGVNDEYETLGVLEVVAPQRPDLVLTTDIPDSERYVLVLDGFHVEADGRNCSHNLAELEVLMMHNRTYSAEIAHNVSARKRKEIVARAEQLNLSMTNKFAKVQVEESQ